MEKTLLLEIDGKTYPLLLKKKAGVKRMTLRYKKEKGEAGLKDKGVFYCLRKKFPVEFIEKQSQK